MTHLEKDKIDALRALIEDQILPDIQQIKRGVYGDEGNGVEGLIQRTKKVEIRVTKWDEFRKKAIWIAGALLTATQLAVSWFISWFKQ